MFLVSVRDACPHVKRFVNCMPSLVLGPRSRRNETRPTQGPTLWTTTFDNQVDNATLHLANEGLRSEIETQEERERERERGEETHTRIVANQCVAKWYEEEIVEAWQSSGMAAGSGGQVVQVFHVVPGCSGV